jgi:hypothetical protein
MAQHAYLDFARQEVIAANFLLLHQTEFAQLFQMMLCNTGAAETQCSLDFSNAHRSTIL